MQFFLLVLSLGLILLASYAFTNGIERLGQRLNMHQAATGSILAAVGTALPETIIPLIALLLYHDAASRDVAIGAIVGAPFMLATLAFAVTGVAVLACALAGRRGRRIRASPAVVSHDLIWFLALYGIALLASFLQDIRPLQVSIAIALLAAYGWYVRRTIRAEGEGHEELEPLYLARALRVQPTGPWISAQIAVSLGIMAAGAHLFVRSVEAVAEYWKVSAAILSIIITPVATELPEKLNSVLWIRQRKDTLAIGNITGAMVFQSAIPVAVGMLLTPWNLKGPPLVTGLLALASAALALGSILWRRTLSPVLLTVGGSLFYGAFIFYILRVQAQ